MESQRISEPGRTRHRGFLGGLTPADKDIFQATELQRLIDGSPKIDELGLSSRAFGGLYRFGVKTVQGVEDLLNRGLKPYHVGQKLLEETRGKLDSYKEAHQAL